MHCGEAFAEFEQLQAHMKTYHEDEEEIKLEERILGGKGGEIENYGLSTENKDKNDILSMKTAIENDSLSNEPNEASEFVTD